MAALTLVEAVEAPALPRIGAADSRDAAMCFKAARAVSTDNLRPRHAALLSNEALGALAEMFHCFERLGCVASGLANLAAFIPKSDGGERAIGKFLACMLFMSRRAWR